ncbi:hypothetical protein BJ165DRAFT_1406359 [Panaeolus papilionaceus]|nr:hypothetical protein BJ165DRAFT_1406359 [Panaeolus papilionaceus]
MSNSDDRGVAQNGPSTSSGRLKPRLTPIRVNKHLCSPQSSYCMKLVPRGRFLISVDFESRDTVEIYDLSLLDEWSFDEAPGFQVDTDRLELQTCIRFEQHDLVTFSFHPSPSAESDSLRFLLICGSDDVELCDYLGNVHNGMSPYNQPSIITVSVEPPILRGNQNTPGVYIYTIPPLTLDTEELSHYHPGDRVVEVFLPFPRRTASRLPKFCHAISKWYTGSGWPIWFKLIRPGSDHFHRVKLVQEERDTVNGRHYNLDILPIVWRGRTSGSRSASVQMAYENNEKVSTWWGNSSSYAGMSCHFDGTFPANDIIREESSRDAVDISPEPGYIVRILPPISLSTPP